jgi:arabinofuranosyltransferase
MDFSSSGLENPLLYLLLSIFFYYYYAFFKSSSLNERKKNISRLLFVLGLMSISRHDISTLIAIPSMYVVFVFCKNAGYKQGLQFLLQKSYLLLVPLLLWTVFSVIYYGVPFPNTAYAKMLHGIPRADLIDFGLLYIKVSLIFDKFALLVLFGLLLRVIWKRELSLLFLASGVLLNFCYVIYVGGDFMQGRFISEALFVSVLGLVLPSLVKHPVREVSQTSYIVPVLVVALFALMLFVDSPLKLRPDSGFDISEGRRHYSWRGILNERNFYFKTNSLWAYLHRDVTQPFPDHKWCRMGISAREQNKQSSDFGGIGMYGYCAGLDLVVIDNLALGEPFLARLPKAPDHDWRAGHFHRDYPRGYYESRLSHENHIQEPHLAMLWSDVAQLAHEPLFTLARWQAIRRINSGYYGNIGDYYFADLASSAQAGPTHSSGSDKLTP